MEIFESSNRTIAYLDILGFKTALQKYSSSMIGSCYYEAITKAQNHYEWWINTFHSRYIRCSCYVGSDTIVVISPDDSIEGFLSVVLYAKFIMQHLIVRGLPIRGGIGFGDVFLKENPLILLGNGFINAKNLEEEQQWIGISIDESAEEQFKEFFKNEIVSFHQLDDKQFKAYSNPSLIRYMVPMNNNQKLLYTINWLDGFSLHDEKGKKLPNKEIISIIEKLLPPDDKNKEKTVKKYAATSCYIDYLDLIIRVDADGTQQHFLDHDKFTFIS